MQQSKRVQDTMNSEVRGISVSPRLSVSRYDKQHPSRCPASPPPRARRTEIFDRKSDIFDAMTSSCAPPCCCLAERASSARIAFLRSLLTPILPSGCPASLSSPLPLRCGLSQISYRVIDPRRVPLQVCRPRNSSRRRRAEYRTNALRFRVANFAASLSARDALHRSFRDLPLLIKVRTRRRKSFPSRLARSRAGQVRHRVPARSEPKLVRSVGGDRNGINRPRGEDLWKGEGGGNKGRK